MPVGAKKRKPGKKKKRRSSSANASGAESQGESEYDTDNDAAEVESKPVDGNEGAVKSKTVPKPDIPLPYGANKPKVKKTKDKRSKFSSHNNSQLSGTESQDNRESEYETDSELYQSFHGENTSAEVVPSLDSQESEGGSQGGVVIKRKEEAYNPAKDSSKGGVTKVPLDTEAVVSASKEQSGNRRSDPAENFPVSTAARSILGKIESKPLPNWSQVTSASLALKANNGAKCSENQPLLDSAPREGNKTSWWSCCGLCDMLRGSNR